MKATKKTAAKTSTTTAAVAQSAPAHSSLAFKFNEAGKAIFSRYTCRGSHNGGEALQDATLVTVPAWNLKEGQLKVAAEGFFLKRTGQPLVFTVLASQVCRP